MERQVKLNWSDLLNVWLWHRHSTEGLVNDDTAYVALLRLLKFVEYAIRCLEETPTVDEPEEK